MSAPTSRERPALAAIALGSNIEPEANLRRAVERLAERLPIRAVSRVYESEAVGAPGTPPFLNAAVLVATDLSPAALKREVLRPLEAELGRVRSADRNAPRTIDLDLVVWGDRVLDGSIETHAHLALPLADLAPEARHPARSETWRAIAARFARAPGIRLAALDLGASASRRSMKGELP